MQQTQLGQLPRERSSKKCQQKNGNMQTALHLQLSATYIRTASE